MTDEHPFYIEHVGWTAAKSLEAGDTLLGAEGTLIVVSNEHEAHPDGVTVYNLEVEQAHTYFVLAEDAGDAAAVWVHNATYPTNNPHGQHGKADHRAKVTTLAKKARGDFPSGIIHQGTSILSKTGINRRPDVWVEDAITGDVLKIYEAARATRMGKIVTRELAKRVQYKAARIPSHFGRV